MSLSYPEYHTILRHDFASFIERAFMELNPHEVLSMAPYIEVIASRLEDCRMGRTKRLIINLPPRHLKSHCGSVAFAAWVLGHRPGAHIICASYGQDLADKLARDCRKIMQSEWYRRLFPTRLGERTAVNDFMTTAQGTRMATSVSGVLTGRGAELIIIDDPIKPDDALSETQRKATNQWFDGTLRSRLNDKETGAIVIIMQRLHQDDLVGHVLEQETWDVLSFPAIAEEDEEHRIDSLIGSRIYTRRAGDVLDPARESLQTLAAIRQATGEYSFASQYQQNPIPVGGAVVKTEWLRTYAPDDLPKSFTRTLQSWDTANKASDLNDYSVCTIWGERDRHFYLLDVIRQRLNFPELRRRISEVADQDRRATVLIEDKASGTQLIQDLKGTLHNVRGYKPPAEANKLMRLYAQTAVFENGYVHLPQQAPWLAEYVRELTSFPGSKYDDQVDSTTQALDYMKTNSDNIAVWRRAAGLPPRQ